MDNFLVVTILESLYIIYMLNYFKTRYSVAHPLTFFNNDYIKHPIGYNSRPISMVCQFGKDGGWLIAVYLVVRYLVHQKNIKLSIYFSKFAFLLIFILSLMNFNVVLYLVPFYITEIYLIKNSFKI